MSLRALALAVSALALAGCVRAGDRPGGSVAGAAVCSQGNWNKQAALVLGQRYEEGLGVMRDFRQAARCYRVAATFTSGTTYVYSPPVRKGGSGRVLPVRTGPDVAGLPEAKYRLALFHLTGLGVRLDIKQATRLLEEAARQGHEPAAKKLRYLEEEAPKSPVAR